MEVPTSSLDSLTRRGCSAAKGPCRFDIRVTAPISAMDPAGVVVTGEVDIATAPEMERVLLKMFDCVGASDIVVDMASTSFIDCIGVGVLVGVANRARSSGRTISVRRPSRQVCRVLHLTGLAEFFLTGGLRA